MKINQLKFGIYLSYISLFVTNITNLLLTPFIIRSLGQSEYGLYTLIGAFVGYIAVLDFGLGDTTVRFVSKYRAENDKKGEDNFLLSILVMYLFISLVVIVVGSLLLPNLDNIFGKTLTIKEIEIAKVMFLILVVNLAFTLPMNLFTGIITAYEKFVFPRVLTIAKVLVRAILILILLSFGYKAISIVLVDATLNIFLMIISMLFVYFKLNVRIRLGKINIEVFKEIFAYSSLIFLSVIVDQIYWRIGQTVLGIVANTIEVAIFSIGMVFGQYFISFSTAISGVFLPKITKMVYKNSSSEELTNLLIKTGRLQFLILGLALGGFILLGKRFILLWAGPGYEESWKVALIVIIPLSIVLTQTIGISILQAKKMHAFRAYTYLAIAMINIFISVYFAEIYGAVGAAIGTTLSLVFGNIFAMNIYYHLKVGINIPRFYKEISKGLLPSFLFSTILGIILLIVPSTSWLILGIQCIIYSFLYMLFMWKFGMNSYEKTLFLNEFRKLRVFKIRSDM